MEDQHKWNLKDYNVMLVYHAFMDHEEKKFHISFDLRDYSKRYCVMANLSEEMFIDLIQKYTEAKEAGYKYDNLNTKFKKGDDER